MKKFLKNFPIETYILLLPALLFLLIINVYLFSNGVVFAKNFFHGKFLSLIIGVNIFFPIIFLIIEISIIEFIFMLRKEFNRSYFIKFMRSALFILGTFYFIGLALSVSIQFIFNTANPVRTATNSIMFTNWDYSIFGMYPWLSLHSFITMSFIQNFIYNSYLYTIPIILIFLFIFAFKNIFLFRKFLLSYLIVTAIGIPFWVIFPALAPDIMYRANILDIPVESKLKMKLDNTYFSENTKVVLSSLQELWIDKTKQSLPVTTFPSMHSAWGIIVAVIGIELWAPFAVVLVPWVLAELIGTMLTLEHYAVDTIFGIILGFLALYIASYLLKFEKKKNLNQWDLFSSVRQFQESSKNFLDWIKSKIKFLLKLK